MNDTVDGDHEQQEEGGGSSSNGNGHRISEGEENIRVSELNDNNRPIVSLPPQQPLEQLRDGEAVTTHDDDDTDDWSRAVETDEVHAAAGEGSFRMESVLENRNSSGDLGNESSNGNVGLTNQGEVGGSEGEGVSASPVAVLRPSQRELTMKEKLVLRERERRIETERARLKRQFALSNNNLVTEDEQGMADEGESGGIHLDTGEGAGGGMYGATESVATLGEESTMVHPDEDPDAAQQQARLPVTMERFLRNSDSFNPQLEPTDEEQNMGDNKAGTGGSSVLMERFLNDPVVTGNMDVNPTASGTLREQQGVGGGQSSTVFDEHQRTVSFDVDLSVQQTTSVSVQQETSQSAPSNTRGDISIDANTSLQANMDDENSVVELLDGTVASSDDTPLALHGMTTSSAVPDEPRVLTLTEADMQEMVATEVESIANYPPSEREDNLSEVGELADFAAHPATHLPRGDISQDTPTTAMDSASLISGGHGSEKLPSAVSSDRHSVDDGDGAASVNDTVAAQPPSEADVLSPIADLPSIGLASPAGIHVTEDMKQPPLGTGAGDLRIDGNLRHELRQPQTSSSETTQPEIVNRRIRPGMVNLLSTPTASGTAAGTGEQRIPQSALTEDRVVVDGFDFDKHDHRSPGFQDSDSFQNLPDDHALYSPEMHVSPLLVTKKMPPGPNGTSGVAPEYGALEEGQIGRGVGARTEGPNESAPLLGDVPPEIITRREKSGERRNSSLASLRMSLRSRLNSVFSDVRSKEDEEKEEIHNESSAYLRSSTFARAVPERIFALTITLVLEMPVLLMISGGADALCDLVGRRRYQLLLSFIPLTSAISGNVGLQASTLTTRAISHSHVTEHDFFTWFLMEIGAAGYLGLGMGFLLGVIAYVASGMDIAFALTILIAQCLSIVTAGCTGTIAPLLFSFIFKRDSGKWGGPLETAVQDIVGSFAMVVLSYHLLSWLGPGPIDPSDMCGGASPEQAGIED